ncbi:hypothetical protein B0H11DRAFT_2109228 [Mycena galericulata]|nr:hypothetical protein B0H11DRAFT_2109228 [Mycena galericulata]
MTSNPQTRGKLRGGLWVKKTPSVYSPAQVSEWLSKIKYPGDLDSFKPSLNSLSFVARLSLTTFPFENTPMHYTEAHSMDITYEGLYQRLVASSGGTGSYCFGLNGLFFQMLKGLGFRVYAGSGRINEQAPGVPEIFHAFVHMILFVQPIEGSNTTYFSSPNSQGPEKFEWRLQSIHDSKEPPTTRVLYSFIEDEFFDADYRAFNYSVLGLTAGLFWENVVCMIYFWMSDEEVRAVDDTVDIKALTPLTRYMGRLAMVGNAVRRTVGTQTTVLCTMKTETDRADALKKFFGITIPYEDLKHIRGRGAELKESGI